MPVRRLTGAAESVARTQDLTHRIPDTGEADELARLAGSFNTMLSALESSRLAQRQLVSDASHELRTPLTSVRANLDALAAGASLSESERARAVDAARSQLAELTVLVGDLVDLSNTGVDCVELEDVRLDLAVAAAVDRARVREPDCRFALHAEPCLVRAARSRTCWTTLASGAPRTVRSRWTCATARCRCTTTGRESRPRICRACLTASTAPQARARCPARASGLRSCATSPRRTAVPCTRPAVQATAPRSRWSCPRWP